MEFKVGDRVRVINDGKVGTIRAAGTFLNKPWMIVDFNSKPVYLYDREIKRIFPEPKFKVEDRVKVVGKFNTNGTIIKVDIRDGLMPYEIKLDTGVTTWCFTDEVLPLPTPSPKVTYIRVLEYTGSEEDVTEQLGRRLVKSKYQGGPVEICEKGLWRAGKDAPNNK